MAELADAHDSGSCARKGVEVQVLSSALSFGVFGRRSNSRYKRESLPGTTHRATLSHPDQEQSMANRAGPLAEFLLLNLQPSVTPGLLVAPLGRRVAMALLLAPVYLRLG